MEIKELKQRFLMEYGGAVDGIRVFSAAARVNLIGEHVDYNGGRVFPAALNLRCLVLARVNDTNCIKMRATTIADEVELDIDKLDTYRDIPWGNYQAGVASVMQNQGYKIVGCDLLYDANVPFGSGLSSSAAIEVATAFTFATFSNEATHSNNPIDLVQLAVMSQKAENEYAGVNCGIMDQFASALGKKNMAILLDCKTLDYEYVPLELGEYELVVANCNKKRSLIVSKYNERRSECETALAILKKSLNNISCLAEITPEIFEQNKHLLDGKVLDRAKHVVYECDRVKKSCEALKRVDLTAFGEILNQSHYSLRDLYEVTGTELDTLSELSRNHEYCIGSRMTGAGFGGCTVSLVRSCGVKQFIADVNAAYEKAIGHDASFYATSIEDGAQEII